MSDRNRREALVVQVGKAGSHVAFTMATARIAEPGVRSR
jgi:hypothetical protein